MQSNGAVSFMAGIYAVLSLKAIIEDVGNQPEVVIGEIVEDPDSVPAGKPGTVNHESHRQGFNKFTAHYSFQEIPPLICNHWRRGSHRYVYRRTFWMP